MPETGRPWTLENFLECLDRWSQAETPADDLRVLVTGWIFTRLEDPYVGVRREPGFDNLWFGPLPGSDVGRSVVACAYWIEESTRTVRCDSFATLTRPV